MSLDPCCPCWAFGTMKLLQTRIFFERPGMRSDDYTAHHICQAMGMPGFAVDPVLQSAGEALRLLLKPSFDPEICITIISDGQRVEARVVAARWMIWHLFEMAPMMTYRDQCELPIACFQEWVKSAIVSGKSADASGIAIDGMSVESILIKNGELVVQTGRDLGEPYFSRKLTGQIIQTVWAALQDVNCKNALALAARYEQVSLPSLPAPAPKMPIQTAIIGTKEDKIELLKAMKKQFG
ncbi:hypothetical protein [Undibacterium sp. TC9W]|uniref:hypothetical protein n=1 Tax=Undibacterium sp. TC9W TaxID=3413053 RepID=UPI003BF06777